MAVEKKFVKDGYTKASLDEHFAKQLGRSGYGGMNMSRTPLGTQITIYSEKPGMVIGKAGKVIRKLTQDVVDIYGVDNPQIDAQEVKKSELNAQIMANRLASSIERGWYFRKAGTNTIRAVMAAGALGCEVIISGKLTGARARTEKFIDGYVKHSGHPAEQIVDTGYAVAVKKLGTLGCRVKIVQPGAVLPDAFKMKEGMTVEPKADEVKAADCVPETITVEEVTVTAVVSDEGVIEAAEVVETVTNIEVCAEDTPKSDEIVVEDSDINESRRLVEGVWQHKHDKHDYWHPMARVHKEA
ncbi:MAG: 30S ribosomal protein S3 [Methanosarcinales archaeon]|jgi:small subunit ribosomal protein S3|nr:30S ribosomal protein S3 [Methanosarcinales archaeon]